MYIGHVLRVLGICLVPPLCSLSEQSWIQIMIISSTNETYTRTEWGDCNRSDCLAVELIQNVSIVLTRVLLLYIVYHSIIIQYIHKLSTCKFKYKCEKYEKCRNFQGFFCMLLLLWIPRAESVLLATSTFFFFLKLSEVLFRLLQIMSFLTLN